MSRSAVSKIAWMGKARTLAFWFLALLVAASIGGLLGVKPAGAAEFRVNSTADAADALLGDGQCSTEVLPVGTRGICTLRAAIEEANANDASVSDTITFSSGLSGTITLTQGELAIANDNTTGPDLTIEGPEGSGLTVNANNSSRVFLVGSGADVAIDRITITGGRAEGSTPDNIQSQGGGILSYGNLTLTNSTVSGNTATNASGGIYNVFGALTITNSTVSANTSTNSSGGGIYNAGTARLTNTIVARNRATADPDVGGMAFDSEGNNLIGNTGGSTGWSASDLLNQQKPLLGPLQNNGGPTNTLALWPGSPAIDAADNDRCPAVDQRGITRKDGDGDRTVICDIGAYERSDLSSPKVSSTTPPTGATGVKRRTNLTAAFSEKMTRTTLNKSTFKLFKVNSNGSTTQITNVTVSSSTDGLNVTLNPSNLLAANTKYKVVVSTQARDLAGNQLDQSPTKADKQQKAWTFKTGG